MVIKSISKKGKPSVHLGAIMIYEFILIWSVCLYKFKTFYNKQCDPTFPKVSQPILYQSNSSTIEIFIWSKARGAWNEGFSCLSQKNCQTGVPTAHGFYGGILGGCWSSPGCFQFHISFKELVYHNILLKSPSFWTHMIPVVCCFNIFLVILFAPLASQLGPVSAPSIGNRGCCIFVNVLTIPCTSSGGDQGWSGWHLKLFARLSCIHLIWNCLIVLTPWR